MRVGLKLFMMLLLEGLSEVAAGSLTFPDARTVNQTVRAYVSVIETTINERVLREEWNPSQWKCPYDEKEKKLGPLSTEDTKIRKVIDKLELLIEVSVTNQVRKEKWLRYGSPLKILIPVVLSAKLIRLRYGLKQRIRQHKEHTLIFWTPNQSCRE